MLRDSIAHLLPAEHPALAQELRRSLLRGRLGVAQRTSRGGRDRADRSRVARADGARAVAAPDAARALGLVKPSDLEPLLELLGRLSAMLVRLAANGV